jgi:hypothetical protein
MIRLPRFDVSRPSRTTPILFDWSQCIHAPQIDSLKGFSSQCLEIWPCVPNRGDLIVLTMDSQHHAFHVTDAPIWFDGHAFIRVTWRDLVEFVK